MKINIQKYNVILAATSFGFSSPSFAQDSSVETPLVNELDMVVVIGTLDEYQAAEASEDLAGPYDIVTRDELRYEHPDDTLELFNKVPGVNIARYNQGIINTDIGIRGFGS